MCATARMQVLKGSDPLQLVDEAVDDKELGTFVLWSGTPLVGGTPLSYFQLAYSSLSLVLVSLASPMNLVEVSILGFHLQLLLQLMLMLFHTSGSQIPLEIGSRSGVSHTRDCAVESHGEPGLVGS